MTEPILTDMPWCTGALEAFEQSLNEPLDPEDVGGKNGRSFGSGLEGVNVDLLPAGQIKRSEVFNLASDPSVGTATVAAAVMAWGGMQINFRNMLFNSGDRRWLRVAEDFRNGTIDRKEAYAQFRNLRDAGGLKGAGPAYFTKLIYFLTPRGANHAAHGYIMDQWAGCSINLLLDREVVLMDSARAWSQTKSNRNVSSSFTVSDVNTEEDYEAFCSAMAALAARFDRTPDQIDRAVLARGGRIPSTWRAYVIKHRVA